MCPMTLSRHWTRTPYAWGLSRSEYVRRRLSQDAGASDTPVTVEDLARFADTFGDLADRAVMSQSWR